MSAGPAKGNAIYTSERLLQISISVEVSLETPLKLNEVKERGTVCLWDDIQCDESLARKEAKLKNRTTN